MQGGFQAACVGEKVRHQDQRFLGEAFAVIVRGAVAIVAIREPAFHGSAVEQPMLGGVTKNILISQFIHSARVADISLNGFAQQLARGFQRQLETFYDGVSVNLESMLSSGARLSCANDLSSV